MAKTLGRAIFDLRRELGLNQTEFGMQVGVTAMSVSRWEADSNCPPGECTIAIAKLAKDPESFWYFLSQIGLTKKDIHPHTT
ncbi:MAG TPA: helix-turn-helix domain-containing protein [Terriglobales bacterium]|nr:helix-turn-helix domain-containing protein [Terriglobales bacterium]